MNDLGPGLGFKEAVYEAQVIRAYKGNKFIEALPPLADEKSLAMGMYRRATVDKEERGLSAFQRIHAVKTIHKSFMQPLSDHIYLAMEVSTLIRAGYVGRDPSSPQFLRSLGRSVAAMDDAARRPNTEAGEGMAVIGMSGVGKSTAIEAVLRAYPEVIWHRELTGPLRTTHQVTYVKVRCPVDGSIITVCSNFFRELDRKLGTNYHYLYTRNATMEQMRDQMGTLCFLHGVGLFVIDEVQNLVRDKGGSSHKLLNFFLVLRDTLKVPVIAIGTPEAIPLLSDTLQRARRYSGQPLFERMRKDGEFEKFCEGLFPAYYLRTPLDPTTEFRDTLYDLSQGITDVVIMLFELAQARALTNGEESIEPETLEVVYEESLHLLHEHLSDLREGRQSDGRAWEAAIRQLHSEGRRREAVSEAAPVSRKRATPGRTGQRPPDRGTTGSTPDTQVALDTVPVARLVTAFDARKVGASGYAALRKAGYIRDLGAEVLAGG